MTQVKRETAIICTIKDLLQGNFIRTEGWNPSYFSTEVGNISRVNLISVLVGKEEGLIIDDGTGKILLRSFETNLPELKIGELLLIIGRPRIFNEQKYIVPEIIKKIQPKWAELRKLQLDKLVRHIQPVIIEKKECIVSEASPTQNPYQKIVEFIKDLDSGNGADTYEVEKRSNLPNAGELISRLIEEGEIFEVKPGKIKLLE